MAAKKDTSAIPKDRRRVPKEVLDLPGRIERAMDERGYPKGRGRYARLADSSKLSPGQISAIKSGSRAEGITAAMVVTLADALKVNPGWLLTGRGSMDGVDAPTIEEIVRSAVRSELQSNASKLIRNK